jgi:AcrR family transcriptional regulator
VYRHFGDERGVRDAVMHRLEEQAGIELAGMSLGDVVEVARRVFDHVSTYPLESRRPLDPTLSAANERQQAALREAVAAGTPGWPGNDRETVAAVLDLLWSVGAYERLAADWGLDHEAAARGLTWVIGLVTDAVRKGRRPG